MEFLENDDYKSVHTNYYNYTGKTLLSLDYKNELVEYHAINIFAYTINNEKKYPFQQILLTKSVNNQELGFPKIQLFNNFNKNELIDYTKVCLFGFLMLENYELFNDLIKFDGFYEYNNSLYLFFDLTKNEVHLCDDSFSGRLSNKILWFGLIDEIVNHKKICNIKINEFVAQFFQENQSLCFLADENDSIYELPITSFISKTKEKLNYTYIFGQIKDNKNGILGPYYYFKDYYNAYEEALNLIKDDTQMVIVRFALFTGNVKYIENYPNDPIDESEMKRQRLQDPNLDQNVERLTMRISDHDGKWADNYDSVYLGNLELDYGNFLNKQLFVVKEYGQQIPLTYHFVNNKSLK
jgi:hypothetical protein